MQIRKKRAKVSRLAVLIWSHTVLLNAQSPNIVIIMADDLGYGDISLNGGITQTPNIDALLTTGTRLNNFLVAPVCSPTRAGLLTGINPLKIGNGPKTEGILDPTIMNFGRFFQNNNYKTGFFGKTHNGKSPHLSVNNAHINDYGFDRFVGFYAGGTDYEFKGTSGWYEDRNLRIAGDPSITTVDEENYYVYATDLITNKANAFINTQVTNGDPFLCYIPYNAVHTPYTITDELLLRVPSELLDKVPSLRTVAELNRAALDRKQREWNAEKFDDTQWTDPISNLTADETKIVYAALTISLDDNIKKLMDKLIDLDIMDNTVILFISDNGANLNGSNLPLAGGKHNLYEGGIRIPAGIIIPPSVIANPLSQVNDICTYLDVFPTMVELANLDSSLRGIDGKSMVEKIRGTSTTTNEDYYYFSKPDYDMLRGDQWKLFRKYNQYELYDLHTDPNESSDLSNNPAYISELNILIEKIEEMALENLMANGHVPLINPPSSPLEYQTSPENEIISYPIEASIGETNEVVVPFFQFGGAGRSDGYLEYDIKVEISASDLDKLEYCYISHAKGNPYFDNKLGVDKSGDLLQSRSSLSSALNQWNRINVGIGNIAPNAFNQYVLVYKFSSPADAVVYLDNVTVKNFRTSEVKKLFIENSTGNQRLDSTVESSITIINIGPGLSVDTISPMERIYVSPNPVKNILKIKNSKNDTYQARVYSVLGKEVARSNLSNNVNSCDVSHLNSGMYMLELKGLVSEKKLKFIKL